MLAASDTVRDVTAWWDDEAAMQRYVADLLASELAAMRLTGPARILEGRGESNVGAG